MTALVLLPFAVAAAFLSSGLAKLGGARRLAEAAQRFRIPAVFATLGWGRAFIALEIVVGAVIVATPGPWSPLALATAALVLAGFLTVAVRSWRRGDTFDCGCFGARGNTRVGPGLVARNAALLAAALGGLLAAALGSPTPLEVLGDSSGRAWVVVAAILAASGLAVQRLTAKDRVRAAAEEARATLPTPTATPPGMAPTFEVTRHTGDAVDSRMLVALRPHLMVFVRPGCGSCDNLLNDTAELDAILGDDGPLLVFAVSVARFIFEEQYPQLADRVVYGIASATEKLDIAKTPGAVLLGLNGRLVAGPVLGETEVRELITDARRLLAQPLPPLS
ncbi:MauE/DoxX family redox-associated membrane protein [Rathayibacter toxicus]|uniref:Methylamine utilisation protein MauE domain-containing protein n=1 Tax=Rathayibacter toxicus TaxID=145458 RepID=A0A2S5Y856_9MICO|nr:MauE/DoxX family redox-associated membrane protein [Rathayibacter toxicus]ALS57196.1 hypothetical protein APU90_04955 [Rathayibacter toxicus]PPG22930.1 hypothetical protein C5D15_01315 [Rathayibacter toxicus]PPG47511.1 hypothetical protein C5D16_01305 [Rathayibacter toxicus]PPH24656.1 hypothetical protein C5D17_01295 [Rathayibacter toxicus]PPH58582.1 hypothetical protein C5D30_01305 [Rathayibacter toxicus]